MSQRIYIQCAKVIKRLLLHKTFSGKRWFFICSASRSLPCKGEGYLSSNLLGGEVESGITGAHEEAGKVETHLVIPCSYGQECLAVQTVIEVGGITSGAEVGIHAQIDTRCLALEDVYTFHLFDLMACDSLGMVIQLHALFTHYQSIPISFLFDSKHACVGIEGR